MTDKKPAIPEEVSNQLLTAFNNDPALAAALKVDDRAKVEEAIASLWTGPSSLPQAFALDAFEKSGPPRHWSVA